MLRRAFTLPSSPRSARLYAAAGGLVEVHANGVRIGEQVLAPGHLDADRHLPWQVWDLAGHLVAGENVIGLVLADGWYCGSVGSQRLVYGSEPRVLVQLRIHGTDGSRVILAGDADWQTAPSPILAGDLQLGEDYDARRELAGWCAPGCPAGDWHPARRQPQDQRVLRAHRGGPVRRQELLAPVTLRPTANGSVIVDFGQNLSGWVELRLPATTAAGTQVTVRHAEVLDATGGLYTANLLSALSTDRYTSAGGAVIWQPRSTCHGFRYAEIIGWPGELRSADLAAVVVHTDLPDAARFVCAHAGLERLHRNTSWSQRGNAVELPTDCPSRCERLGWSGDVLAYADASLLNHDAVAFFDHWLTSLFAAELPSGGFDRAAPPPPEKRPIEGGPGWSDAAALVPWLLWRRAGDLRPAARYWDALVRYILWLDHVDHRQRRAYGDWLHHQDETPKDLLGCAFSAHSAALVAELGTALGHTADAARCAAVRDRQMALFNREFVTPAGRLAGDSQAAYALALGFGLLPEALRRPAADRLAARIAACGHRITTGFLATAHLLSALSSYGYQDLAWRLLIEDGFPSWLYQVGHGATTTWESWSSWHHERGFADPRMNSFNHAAFSSVAADLLRLVAGLSPDARRPDGFDAVIAPLIPRPGTPAAAAVPWVEAEVATPRGRLGSSWRVTGGHCTVEVQVPAGARVRVVLPLSHMAQITLDGQPLGTDPQRPVLACASGAIAVAVGSGCHHFVMPWG